MCFWITVSSEAIVKTNCPSILRNSFVSLTVEENGVQNACGNGVINGCFGSTEVVISTNLSCHSNSFISGKDPFFVTKLFCNECLYCSVMYLRTIPKTFVILVAVRAMHLCHSVNSIWLNFNWNVTEWHNSVTQSILAVTFSWLNCAGSSCGVLFFIPYRSPVPDLLVSPENWWRHISLLVDRRCFLPNYNNSRVYLYGN